MTLLLLNTALADCIHITGASVHTPDGPKSIDVVVRAGEIKRLGRDLDVTGCKAVDGEGRVLTYGFTEVDSQMGLVEVRMEDSTLEIAGGYPSYRVADGYDPRSSVIAISRQGGVTSAVAVPTGSGIRGTSAWVDLAAQTQAEALVDTDVALHTALGAHAAASLGTLRIQLDDARTYARAKSAYDRDQLRDLSLPMADLQALQPVLRGDLPLVVQADRASDIEALLRFADEQEIRLVLRSGAEAWLMADELAAAEVPVILDPMLYGPRTFDQLRARADNAALLHAAGVEVMFTTGSAHNSRELRHLAGNAVREGLPHEAALDAITAAPARVFGVEDRGTIEVGRVANLVLWDGDPLEVTTQATWLMIGGNVIPLESRHTALRDRYLTLPGSPIPAVELD